MHLRDTFAAHVAAALATRVERPERIAIRAYEIAEAMLLERARRGHGDVEGEGGYEAEEFAELDRLASEGYFNTPTSLLDEPMPMSEREDVDPAWADLASESPAHEADPKWGPLFDAVAKPGLKRTAPPATVDELLRKKA